MQRRRGALLGLAALVAVAVVGLGTAPAHAQKKGGVLRVGVIGEPPALDAHWTTATITSNMTNHLYEGLYTLDEGRRPIPMLAESLPAVSRDGLTYTFKLRQGVKFHNGKEMTSEDVVASLKRWGQQSVYGRVVFAQTADVRAVDRYTVELRLRERSAVVVISLAVPGNFAAIYPREVAEKFKPQEKVTEYVGTGPFRFAEWKPDQYVRFVRFDDYKPRAERPNGYGGRKTAWVDEIRWIPVPDVATRVAQIETGELDFVEQLNIDAYDRLARNPAVRPVVAKPQYWLVAVFNKKEGPMTSQKLRQAWQAALDLEPIMRTVAGGRREFYRIDCSIMFREMAEWHVDVPGMPCNQHDKARARKLLQEAGYKGDPIRFMTTQEYKWMYDFALLTKQQLEDVGFVIDLQVVDWATLVKRRNNPKEYDVFTTGTGLFYDPTHPDFLTSSWPGWTTDEDILKNQAELAREIDPRKRFAIWEQQHRVFYERQPVARYGDLHGLHAIRGTVKGFDDRLELLRFHNVWLEK